MTVNLMFATDETAAKQDNHQNWKAITAVAAKGIVPTEGKDAGKIAAFAASGMIHIADTTVDQVAKILDGKILSNGEMVSAYDCSDYEFMNSFIAGFGPSLLDAETLAAVRAILAQDANSAAALELLDIVIERGLQLTLHGTEHCPAYIKGVNWQADEVEINRTATNMINMLEQLGIIAGMGEKIPFSTFNAAVKTRGYLTDMPDRLRAFVACGMRSSARAVYWG